MSLLADVSYSAMPLFNVDENGIYVPELNETFHRSLAMSGGNYTILRALQGAPIMCSHGQVFQARVAPKGVVSALEEAIIFESPTEKYVWEKVPREWVDHPVIEAYNFTAVFFDTPKQVTDGYYTACGPTFAPNADSVPRDMLIPWSMHRADIAELAQNLDNPSNVFSIVLSTIMERNLTGLYIVIPVPGLMPTFSAYRNYIPSPLDTVLPPPAIEAPQEAEKTSLLLN